MKYGIQSELDRKIKEDMKYLLTSIFFLACLIFFVIFPFNGTIQGYTKSLFFLVVLPALYVKIILRRNLSDYGCNFNNNLKNWFWFVGTSSFSLILVFLFYRYSALKNSYELPSPVLLDFRYFLFYELLLVNVLVLTSSFFYQGIVLFHLAEKFSNWSVIGQSAVYVMLIAIISGLQWKAAPSIIASILGGLVAKKTGSWVYSYIMTLILFIILDAYIIYASK